MDLQGDAHNDDGDDDRQSFAWGPAPPGESHPGRESTFTIRHQDVRVAFDWDRRSVIGSTDLQIVARDAPVSVVQLDAEGMTIASVRHAEDSPLSYRYDGHALEITLPAPLSPHAAMTVSVDYSVERPRAAVFFVPAPHIVWTQGVLTDTRYWLPTVDAADTCPTWTVEVRTAAHECAIATGKLKASRRDDEGTMWTWAQDRPTPIRYLSIAVGPYESATVSASDVGREAAVTYWVHRDSIASAQVAFGAAARVLANFERLLGPAPSGSQLDLLMVPQFPFWTELERWRPVITTTALDERLADPSEEGWPGENGEMMISRRIALEWFGISVAVQNWSDLWLVEGFVNFLAQTEYEAAHGPDAAADIRQWSHVSAFAADRDHRRPLVYDRWVYGPIELLNTEHAGQKGAVVLRMLQAELGNEPFWDGVRSFVSRYAGQLVTTSDFQHTIEEVTGTNLTTFFLQWVYGAGFPRLTITSAYDAGRQTVTLTARQTQRRDTHTGFFEAPLTIEIGTPHGPVEAVLPLRGEVATAEVQLPGPPTYMDLDPEGVFRCEATFWRPTELLIGQLQHDPHERGRIEAARELGQRAQFGDSRRSSRPRAIAFTPEHGPPPLADPEALPPVIHAVRLDPSARVRAAIIQSLSGWDPLSQATLVELTHDPDPLIRRSAAMAMGHARDPVALQRISELAANDPDSDVRRAARFVRHEDPFGEEPPPDSGASDVRPAGEPAQLEVIGSLVRMRPFKRPSGAPSAWSQLTRYVVDAASTRAVKQAAMRAMAISAWMTDSMRSRGGRLLEAMGGDDPAVTPEAFVQLAEPLLQSEDPSMRVAAARDLGVTKVPAAAAVLSARKAIEVDALVLSAIDESLAQIERGDPMPPFPRKPS